MSADQHYDLDAIREYDATIISIGLKLYHDWYKWLYLGYPSEKALNDNPETNTLCCNDNLSNVWFVAGAVSWAESIDLIRAGKLCWHAALSVAGSESLGLLFLAPKRGNMMDNA